MTHTLEELYEKSRIFWGLDSQLLMLAEESSELAVSSLHMVRQREGSNLIKRLDSLAEEIADVEFLIDEMKFYYGLKFKERIMAYRCQKRKRLEKLIEELKP